MDRLVLWQPSISKVTETEWDTLRAWVAQGNQLILNASGGEWDERLPATVSRTTVGLAQSGSAHPITVGVNDIQTGGGYLSSSAQPLLVHLTQGAGRPVLVSWPHGAGRIYWSADDEWLTNARIDQADNLTLAMGLLTPPPGKRVAFDEYHHGFEAIQRWWQILRSPLRFLLLQWIIALAVFFWASGARFGVPRPVPSSPPRAAVEYVLSMSQLYRRSRARGLVVQALYQSLYLTLSHLLGGTQGLGHAEIAQRAAQRTGLQPTAIQNALDKLSPDRKPEPTEAELIDLASQAEDIQRRVRHAGFRDQRDPGTTRS